MCEGVLAIHKGYVTMKRWPRTTGLTGRRGTAAPFASIVLLSTVLDI